MLYVDRPRHYGWRLRGHAVANSHLITDEPDLVELHEMAERLGMKRAWFQDDPDRPHYDLTVQRHRAALELGVPEISSKELIRKLRGRKIAILSNI